MLDGDLWKICLISTFSGFNHDFIIYMYIHCTSIAALNSNWWRHKLCRT